MPTDLQTFSTVFLRSDAAATVFLVHARCRVKVTLHHTYVVPHMHRVVWHIHDVCTVHIRQNSLHGHLKLLVVKWLGLSITVRVRVRARDREWIYML